MLLGPFALFKVLTPPERPSEKEKTTFDTITQTIDNSVTDVDKIEHLVHDRATLATVKAKISPCCDGQIEWKGRIWTAMSFEDTVF